MHRPDLYQSAIDSIAQVAQTGRNNPENTYWQIWRIVMLASLERLMFNLLDVIPRVVQTGPFAGMRYGGPLVSISGFLPKLLGCYEAELHAVVGHLCKNRYDTVVNIGCGDGYYAVGLALSMPASRVYAFDTHEMDQQLCRQTANLNQVLDRVIVAGECDLTQLRNLARESTFIFCDCEGNEVTLLDPRQVPGLLGCDILVEMHEFMDPAIPATLKSRFEATHEITVIPPGGHGSATFQILQHMGQFDQFLATWEARPGLTPWALMTRR